MDTIRYHNTNPRARIVVSAEMKNRKYRVGYVTTFTRDKQGTWGAIIPYGFKSFPIEPHKTEDGAINTILTMPCCKDYTLHSPATSEEVSA